MRKLVVILVAMLAGCAKAGVTYSPESGFSRVLTEKFEEKELSEEERLLAELPEEYARLAVPYLRQAEFPGSEIQVGRVVSDNGNYTSYLASYESEGLKINGLLTRPKGEVPEGGYPAVVFVHGYVPPLSYRTTEKYVAYVDYLARNGLVVFKIDLRGHGSSAGEPNGAYYSADYIYDVLNARASLQKLAYVNPEQVGLWGHSMAGNVVLRAMAATPEIPVGVIWAGAVYTYTDMQEYRISDGSYQPAQNPNRGRRGELYEAVGRVSQDNTFWQMVAPANYVGELKGLVQIHHASNDQVVSVGYSRNLAKIMDEAGTNYELYEYGSGGHNIESPTFETAMARSVEALTR